MPAAGGVLTHCNAGALASCGYGMALGVIRAAVERGHQLHVYADETRPFLQGARLTAWEMMHDGIPTTVLCDNMAASLMRQGKIQAVIVGSDRVAANGDVANKIGTYGVAILAKEHGIPFYVACPWSTIDMATASGDAIPIEQRPAIEVTHHGGKQMTPHGVGIENPAFDVTPARYVTAIITERGILRAPYGEALRGLETGATASAFGVTIAGCRIDWQSSRPQACRVNHGFQRSEPAPSLTAPRNRAGSRQPGSRLPAGWLPG